MNDFSTIDAQSDIAPLVQLQSWEQVEDTLPLPRRGLNVQKLVLHNLTVPFNRRIERAEIERRLALAPIRSRLAALQATIRADVENSPAYSAMKRREILMDSI